MNIPKSYFEPLGYEVEFTLTVEQTSEKLRNCLYGGFIDGEINGETAVLDSVYKVKGLSDKYIIDSNSESMDDQEIGWVYEELSKYGIDQSNSIILTNNVKISKYDNMVTFPFIFFRWLTIWQSNQHFPYVPYSKEYIEKLKSYRKPHKFMALNGEVKEQRMYLCQELHRKGYDKEGLVSLMDNGNLDVKFYKEHFDERRFPMFWDEGNKFSEVYNTYYIDYPYEFDMEYFSKLPFLLDTVPSENNWTPNPKYWSDDDNFATNLSIPKQFIEDCYLQFTSETTFFSSDGKWHHKMDSISEKTYKSILFHPSLIFGSSGNLPLLKSYGFKTFSPVLDESYDEVKSDSDRFWTLFKEIDRLMSLSKDDLHELFVESLPIILYNQNVMYETKHEDVLIKLHEDIKKLS